MSLINRAPDIRVFVKIFYTEPEMKHYLSHAIDNMSDEDIKKIVSILLKSGKTEEIQNIFPDNMKNGVGINITIAEFIYYLRVKIAIVSYGAYSPS